MKPVLLDLFCGAGGCTRGYQEAGFYVVGVDIEPQPNYIGDEFFQGDALWGLRDLIADWVGGGFLKHPMGEFDAIHASPPCQAFTAYQRTGNVGEHPDLIQPIRELLEATGLPYVIENVVGAPLLNPTMLCGSAFGLDIQRHRLFEANFPLMSPGCVHGAWPRDRFPGSRSKERTGSSQGLVRATMEIGAWDIPFEDQKRAMGIDWDVTLPELSNAIPPAYTAHIGSYLLSHLRAESDVAA